MASIRTAGLTKHFGDLRAVNEIDLDLPEGGGVGGARWKEAPAERLPAAPLTASYRPGTGVPLTLF